MHERLSVGVACALIALVAAALTGCQSAWSGASGSARPVANETAAPTRTAAAGYGPVFLEVDECSSFGTTSFTEVPCTSERAAARVVARHDGRVDDGPPCPGWPAAPKSVRRCVTVGHVTRSAAPR